MNIYRYTLKEDPNIRVDVAWSDVEWEYLKPSICFLEFMEGKFKALKLSPLENWYLIPKEKE